MGEKTVRVRVAVAVGMELGEHVYGTAGWSGGSDKDMVNEALDAADLEHRSESVVHFIEADIPIPEPQTIEATVDRAKAIPRERGRRGEGKVWRLRQARRRPTRDAPRRLLVP